MKDATWHEIDRITRQFLDIHPDPMAALEMADPYLIKQLIGINVRNWNEVRIMRNITKSEQKEMPKEINQKADDALKLYGEQLQAIADVEEKRIQELINSDSQLRFKWNIQQTLIEGLQRINKQLEAQIKKKEKAEDATWAKIQNLRNRWAAWRHFKDQADKADKPHDADEQLLNAVDKFCGDVDMQMRTSPIGYGTVIDCSGGYRG